MALRALTRQTSLVLGGRGTLMQQLLSGGLPVASACSGRGACGRCLVTILEGGDHLTPVGAHEFRTLARNGAGPGQRLSCQCVLSDPAADVLATTGYW